MCVVRWAGGDGRTSLGVTRHYLITALRNDASERAFDIVRTKVSGNELACDGDRYESVRLGSTERGRLYSEVRSASERTMTTAPCLTTY